MEEIPEQVPRPSLSASLLGLTAPQAETHADTESADPVAEAAVLEEQIWQLGS
jgi:hypothetical protein